MPSRKNRKKVQRRRALWKANPRCRACGVLTILPEELAKKLGRPPGKLFPLPQRYQDVLATLEHVYSRLDPRRRIAVRGELRQTLYCWKCNTERGNAEYGELPLHERQRRARRYRVGMKYGAGRVRLPHYTVNAGVDLDELELGEVALA